MNNLYKEVIDADCSIDLASYEEVCYRSIIYNGLLGADYTKELSKKKNTLLKYFIESVYSHHNTFRYLYFPDMYVNIKLELTKKEIDTFINTFISEDRFLIIPTITITEEANFIICKLATINTKVDYGKKLTSNTTSIYRRQYIDFILNEYV